jgi:1,2-diacylglycerol 3-alpha-glucosyltransferase
MRIALFSDTFPPEINGVANSTSILRNELEKHGHEVYVVTTFSGSGHAKWDEDGKILRLAGKELKFLYGYVMTSPFHAFALEEIRKLDLDVIHAQTEFGVGIFARICAKQLRVPLVSTYHTTYEDYTHYVNFINSRTVDEVAKKGVARVSKLYGDTSMEVIAPSMKTKNMLEGYHIRKNIDVVPTGLELDRFSPASFDQAKRHEIRSEFGIDDTERFVIYVGRLAKEKSMDIVINGFKKAKDEGNGMKLLIIGSGPDEDNCREMVKKLGMEADITVAGPRQASDIPDYYRAADAFVSASLSETQGMTFIEALASGLPILVRKDEVLEGLCIDGETGAYFSDENDLAEKIAVLRNMEQTKLDEMHQKALEVVRPYSSEVFYEKVIKVYERVVEEYQHQYCIEDVRVTDNIVQLYLISNQKEEMRLHVSMDDFYNLGMRTGGFLISRQVEELHEKEAGVLAYRRCLKRIAAKDRTRKEIYDWLTQNTDCSIETVNGIVERLEEKGYINDERYCAEQIAKEKLMLAGREKIIRDLKKHGLPYEMIVEKMDQNMDGEAENAESYGQKIIHSHHEDSTKKLKNLVISKMIVQGYSADLAKETAEKLDYTQSEDHELENLRRCAYKSKRRYERKFTGTELRNRVYQYCFSQGFESEEIYTVMNEMDW